MITIQSKIHVARIGGMEIFNFFINPSDREYQKWWTGTHLEFHNLRQSPRNIDNIVYMDEYIGKRRVKMTAIVIEAKPGKKITWQFKKIIRLPVWMCLELEDGNEGVAITHTMRAGFEGTGSILDIILRVYLSDAFAKAMDEHAKTEFPKLGDMLLSAKSVI